MDRAKAMLRYALALCLALVAVGCGATAQPDKPTFSPGAQSPYGPPLTATDYAATKVAYAATVSSYPPPMTPTREYYPPPGGEQPSPIIPTLTPEPPVARCDEDASSIPQPRARSEGGVARLTYLTPGATDWPRELWSIKRDGSDARLIRTMMADSFAWAPDGERLAFSYDITAWLSDAGGARTCVLAGHVAHEGASGYYELAWSPRPDLLAVNVFERHGGGNHVRIFDAGDGSWLALNDQIGLFILSYTWSPAWSPDGSLLAYIASDDNMISQIGVSDLKRPAGTRTLVDWPGEYRGLTWSPNGTRIAFSYASGYGQADIYVVDADGSDARQLTADALDERAPAWSPDGNLIAFTGSTEVGGPGDVYVMDPDGANMRQLTSEKRVRALAWRP